LKGIGFSDAEIPVVMRDVGGIIYGKVFAVFLQAVPEDECVRIIAMQPEEIQKYLADHAMTLPPLSQEQFDAIHDETWQDYFKSVGGDR
jgi:hypothetical protein